MGGGFVSMKSQEITYELKKNLCGTMDWTLDLAHPSQALYYWAIYLSSEEVNTFNILCLHYLIYFQKEFSNLYSQQ